MSSAGCLSVQGKDGGERLPFNVTITAECAAGYFRRFRRLDNKEICEICPDDTVLCSGPDVPLPHKLETLKLRPNFWRQAPTTIEIIPCVTDLHHATNESLTPCRGGSNASNYCAPGLTGPLCHLCLEEDEYFDGKASCVKCFQTGGTALLLPAMVVVFVVIILVLILLIRQELTRWPAAFQARYLHPFEQLLPGQAVLKLAISYFQVVFAMPEVFGVPLPPEYHDAMRVLDWMNLDWFRIWVPVSCIGSFGTWLKLKALVPLVVLAVVVLLSVVVASFEALRDELRSSLAPSKGPRRGFGGDLKRISTAEQLRLAAGRLSLLEAAAHGALRALPLVLILLFLLIPSVCGRIFSTFSCTRFWVDDELRVTTSFLTADLSIECAGNECAGPDPPRSRRRCGGGHC